MASSPAGKTNDRQYPPHPLLGVGALLFRGTPLEVLLVQRGKEPLKGYWSLPGGLVETGELLETAVKREVLEETGLTVKPLWLAEIFERIMPDAEGRVEYHYVLADYVCEVLSGEPVAADDAGDVRWAPLTELEAIELTAGTLDVVRRTAERLR